MGREIPRSEVKTAIFDVVVTLIPRETKIVERLDNQGNVIGDPQKVSNLDDTVHTIPSVKFTMNEDHIRDAYNKCPNRFGLDFTVETKLFTAAVRPEAQKVFVSDEQLKEGQFRFELYDEEPTEIGNILSFGSAKPIDTASNDADGNVYFSAYYTMDDLYDVNGDPTNAPVERYLYMKEVVPAYTDGITYDTRVYRLTVKAERATGLDERGDPYTYIIARIVKYEVWGLKDVDYGWIECAKYPFTDDVGNAVYKPAVFKNVGKVDLPATGGSGTTRYYIFGIALLITGFLLLFSYRRRRGSRLTANSAMGKQ